MFKVNVFPNKLFIIMVDIIVYPLNRSPTYAMEQETKKYCS